MGLPESNKASTRFKFIDLPEEVWKVQLIPSRIPLPSNILFPGLEGGFKYEKVMAFIHEYLDECNDLEEIKYYETALKVFELGNQGIQFHRKEQYREAIEAYRLAIELEPQSWVSRYNMAYCHFQLREVDKAELELNAAITVFAGEPRNYALLGDIFVHKENFVQAYGAYHQFLRQARTKGVFSSVAFQLRYQLGLLTEKEPSIRELHPWPFDHRCICGTTWDFPESCPGAGEKSPHAFKDSRYPRASDWHLGFDLKCGTCSKTINEWACDSCGRKYHWGLGTLKTYHPVDHTVSIQQNFFDYGGEDRMSKSYVESVLQDTAFALLEFRYQDALNNLYRASRIVFEEPVYHFKLIEVLKLMGREKEGVKHYENILRSYPDSIHARYGLALLSPNSERTVKLLKDLIDAHHGFAPAYHAIGEALFENGQSEEALKFYHQAMDLDPQWVPVYRSLAMLYQGIGEDHMSIHYRNVLHRMAPYFDDRHENSYIAFAGKLQSQKEFIRSNQVLTSISEIAKAAVTNEEQRVHYELGFEPWLKVKKMRNHLHLGQALVADKLMGQITKVIEEARFEDEGGSQADLRLNLVKTMIDEGLADEARMYLEEKQREKEMDPVAVEWLKGYELDRSRMHKVLSGDRTTESKDVARFAIRSLVEVRSPQKGYGLIVDAEGLILLPLSCVEDQDEVELLTYDGVWVTAKVVARSARAPFAFVKAPPLSEGTYFYVDPLTVPVLRREMPVVVIGVGEGDDFVGAEAHIQQDLLDSSGCRYLILDRELPGQNTGAIVLSQSGALLGLVLSVEVSDSKLQNRLVLDSDEFIPLLTAIKTSYPFIYRFEFCGNCGALRRDDQRSCSCGYSSDITSDEDEEKAS